MKKNWKTITAFTVIAVFFIIDSVLTVMEIPFDYHPRGEPLIHLYGETHGDKAYYDAELEAWREYYDKGCRVLFMELPYYTARYLDIWMREADDAILDMIYDNIEGTLSHTPDYLAFLRSIKENFPETRLTGTDVGHQYKTTGASFLAYLEEQGLADSQDYVLAAQCIEQGKDYYDKAAHDPTSSIREDYMAANFVDAYRRWGTAEIMGIYGSYHTDPTYPSLMAGQIKAALGDIVEGIYVKNLVRKSVSPYSLGFCWTGLIFLLMLFVPNIIWTRFMPEGYEAAAAHENKVLVILEKAGQVVVTASALMFTCFNPQVSVTRNGIYFSNKLFFLPLAFSLMVIYEIWWVRYFRSGRTMNDFYRGILGIPLAGATLPVMTFFILGVYGMNLVMMAGAVILGIGHIGIHAQHARES